MGSKTGLGATQTEWVELVRSLPEEHSIILRDLIARHREQFVGVFYDRLMSNRDAAIFLSQKMVQERLHNSLSDWLLKMFQRTADDVDAFIREQRKVGEVHARIDVPIHVVMQGARLLKTKSFVNWSWRLHHARLWRA